MSEGYLSVLANLYNEATASGNAIATKVAAATVDKGKAVSVLRDEAATDDAKVLAFREWYEKANAQILSKQKEIDEYITSNLLNVESMSDEDIEKAREEYNTHNTTRKSVMSLLQTQPGYSEDWAKDNLQVHLTFKGSKANATSGEGPARPRFDKIELDGKDFSVAGKNAKGEDVAKRTLSGVAAEINTRHKDDSSFTKINPSDLLAALEQAGGANWRDANDVSVNVAGHNLQVWPAKASA